jgi:hypothetical protein
MTALCAAVVHSLLCVNYTIVESKTVLRQARCYARVQSFIYYRIVFPHCTMVEVYFHVLITDELYMVCTCAIILLKPQETDLVYSVIDKAVTAMKAKGIRVKVDNRDHLRPGMQ